MFHNCPSHNDVRELLFNFHNNLLKVRSHTWCINRENTTFLLWNIAYTCLCDHRIVLSVENILNIFVIHLCWIMISVFRQLNFKLKLEILKIVFMFILLKVWNHSTNLTCVILCAALFHAYLNRWGDRVRGGNYTREPALSPDSHRQVTGPCLENQGGASGTRKEKRENWYVLELN